MPPRDAATIRAVGIRAVGIRAVGIRAVGIRAVGIRAVGIRAVGIRAVGIRAVGIRAVGIVRRVRARVRAVGGQRPRRRSVSATPAKKASESKPRARPRPIWRAWSASSVPRRSPHHAPAVGTMPSLTPCKR